MSPDRLAAVVGTAALTFLVIVLAAVHVIQPTLSPIDHFVSEYASGRLGWIVPSGYVLAGFGTVILVGPVFARIEKTAWAIALAGSLIVVSLSLIATGLTRIDVVGSGALTSSGQLHELAGYTAILGLIAGTLVLPAALRRPQVSSGTLTPRLYRWVLPASLVGVVMARPLGMIGLGQRVFLAVAMSWLIHVGLLLVRSDQPSTRTRIIGRVRGRSHETWWRCARGVLPASAGRSRFAPSTACDCGGPVARNAGWVSFQAASNV